MNTRLKQTTLLVIMFGLIFGIRVNAGPPVFTGDVENDFVGPGVVTITDPKDIVMGTQFGNAVSGFDMKDVRLYYDAPTDTLYVGINSFGIAGDADGDGDPGGSSQALIDALGVDMPDFDGSESFYVMLDTDQDGTYDLVTGVCRFMDVNGTIGFRSSAVDYFAVAAPFGTTLPDHTGYLYASPSASAPDLEFTIRNMSLLPSWDANTPADTVNVVAFMGSTVDDGIGEDFVFAFGVELPVLGSIGDYVWEDENGDTVQDANEPPIPGVTLDLLDNNNNVIDTQTTDMNGWYLFSGLPEGSYTVVVTDTANVLDTFALTTANEPYPYLLAAGENHLDADFGYIRGQLGPSVVVVKSYEKVCPDVPCGECEGKVTELTLKYTGADPAFVEVAQKKDGIIFGDQLDPGDEFTVFGADDKGTLGTEITLYVDGVEGPSIHTSCSQPIGPGLTVENFVVVSGYSLEGGELCPVESSPPVDSGCGECEGKVTELTLEYTGANPAFVEVAQKKEGIVFGDQLQPGDEFTVFGVDKKGTLGTEITLYVDGVEGPSIHTSCSQPIGPGLTVENFVVVSGYSLEGGELCPVESSPPVDSGCGECEGKVTELTLEYTGASPAFVEVAQKKEGIIFGDQLDPGDEFTVFGVDKKGTLGTEITLYVDGVEGPSIHTSCSQPIGPGLTVENFVVVSGYSLEGGELCPVQSSSSVSTKEKRGGKDKSSGSYEPCDPNRIEIGDEVRFTITVTASSPLGGDVVQIRDCLDSSLVVVETLPAATVDGSTVTWDLVLPAGDSVTDLVVTAVIADVPAVDNGDCGGDDWLCTDFVEVPVVVKVPCVTESPGTGTPGYWKNHPEAWPVDVLDVGGVTYTKDEAIALLTKKVKGIDKKAHTLFRALVATKLNVLIGNEFSCVADAVNEADAWLTANPLDERVGKKEWKQIEPTKDELDAYNNGLLCAPSRDSGGKDKPQLCDAVAPLLNQACFRVVQ